MRRIVTILLGLLCLSTQLLAQNRTISGKVTDEKGQPIPAASVTVAGTNVGTSTNNEGTFSLAVPSNAKSILVSFSGRGEKEIRLTGSDTYNVTLSSSVKDMQEVVVVAYGTQKKATLTGSVATIKAADIENKPFSSVDKALQGQVAGLQSVSASGAPGANQQIRIRGISSISASNAPLWIIDGVPVNANDLSRLTTTANILSTLNPNDIESVSVLKDAASSAIYGSRAANGVILVTTKKGRVGKTKFRFDTEVGQSDIAYKNPKYRPLTGDEYLAITREGLVNGGYTQTQIDNTIAALGGSSNANFNWLDAVTRVGKQQQYNISAQGGDNRTTFFTSGGYFKQEGTTVATKMDRINGSMRITNKATDKLTIGANINGGFVRQNTPLSGGSFGNPVLSSYFILPTRSAYKPDGSYNILTSEFPNSATFNTVALANMDKRYLKELSLRGSVMGEYNILSNLKFSSTFGGDLSNLEEDQYNNPLYGDGYTTDPTTTGRAYSYYTRYFNWDWTNLLTYRQNISKGGDTYVDLKAGYESQSSRGYFASLQGKGFAPTLLLQYPASTSTPSTANATISDYTFLSQFSSADFSFKDRFVISGSFRRDGSSRFGGNKPYGNFWSVGGSWNVDKESFMQTISFINQLKLRASYGKTGNAGIGNYDWYPAYSYTTGSTYNSAPGSAPSNVGNLDLSWETNKPLNIGLDLAILNSRLGITADWYKRTSTDLLLAVPLSPTSGFASQTRNVGALENKGVELSVNGTPVQSRSFTWNVNFNFAHNTNRVTSLPSPQIGTFILKEGLDVQTFYTRVYAGVDPSNGDPLWYADSARSKTTNNYSSAVRIGYGSASPKYFGGLTNTFSFKGITLEAQFNYQFGNYVQDSWGSYYTGAGFGATFNKVARVLDRWQKAGDVTDMPKYIYGGNKSFQSFSSFYLAKGDFIRLRNLQLGYDLPKTLLSKAKISNAFFYVRGTNLWTWVKDKNLAFDPEQGVASQTNLDVFIPKTVTVGLNLGF